MFKTITGSLNWKLQLLFNAIAIISVVVISVGSYASSSQLAEKLGDSEAKEYLSAMALQAVILGVTVNAGVGAFAFFMSRSITKPIAKATEIATKLSQGDLTVSTQKSKSNDEIGRLLTAENEMVSSYMEIGRASCRERV